MEFFSGLLDSGLLARRQRSAQIDGRCGLADTTFLIGDGDHTRSAAGHRSRRDVERANRVIVHERFLSDA